MWLLEFEVCEVSVTVHGVSNQVRSDKPQIGGRQKEGCMDYFNPVELDRQSLNSSRLGRRFARPSVTVSGNCTAQIPRGRVLEFIDGNVCIAACSIPHLWRAQGYGMYNACDRAAPLVQERKSVTA